MLRTETTVVHLITTEILVSLANSRMILGSGCIDIPSSTDTMNLVNLTPPLRIQICHSEVIRQPFISFACEYCYEWIMQPEFNYRTLYICCQLRY